MAVYTATSNPSYMPWWLIRLKKGYNKKESMMSIIPSAVRMGNSSMTPRTIILLSAVQLKAIIKIRERVTSRPIRIAINVVLIRENARVHSKKAITCRGILNARRGYSKITTKLLYLDSGSLYLIFKNVFLI